MIDARAEAKAAKHELLDFINRSVQRWEILADANPQLVVPKITEPQPPGKGRLSDEELLPAHPKITPPPQPTPTPVVKAVVKVKKVYVQPRSTPYRWPWQDGRKKKTR